jgi:hypothetical protein
MRSQVFVSLQVPYTENEQQFLAHAVQAALRMFRSMNAGSGEGFETANAAQSVISASDSDHSHTIEAN